MNKNDYEQPLLDEIYENSSKKFRFSNKRAHSNQNQKSWNIRNSKKIFFENRINSKNSKYKRKSNIKNNKNRLYINLSDIDHNKYNELKKEISTKETKGFPNLNNTCYMNSFLQILIHTPNFIKELKRIKKEKKIDNELVNSLINLQKNPLLYLKKIKKDMGNVNKSYSDFCQNDSQKFGNDLLNRLIVIIKNENEDEDENFDEKENLLKFDDNFANLKNSKIQIYKSFIDKNFPITNLISLEKMFQFYESKIKSINESNKLAIEFDALLEISINLSNNPDNKDDLINILKNKYSNGINNTNIENEIKNEKLIKEDSEIKSGNPEKENNKTSWIKKICKLLSYLIYPFIYPFIYYYKKKQKNINNKIITESKINKPFLIKKIASLPNILIITINRAILDEPFNINYLHFEKSLNIKDFLDSDILDISSKNTIYSLYAINECRGNDRYSGHCYSYIYTKKKWLLFNDEYIRISNPVFNSKYVVGLFYKKEEDYNFNN